MSPHAEQWIAGSVELHDERLDSTQLDLEIEALRGGGPGQVRPTDEAGVPPLPRRSGAVGHGKLLPERRKEVGSKFSVGKPISTSIIRSSGHRRNSRHNAARLTCDLDRGEIAGHGIVSSRAGFSIVIVLISPSPTAAVRRVGRKCWCRYT